jgi:hypothetical protein
MKAITEIKIPYAVIMEQTETGTIKYLYDELIKIGNIDTNYYSIILSLLNYREMADFEARNYIVEYELEVKECWNDLTECQERLSIGL